MAWHHDISEWHVLGGMSYKAQSKINQTSSNSTHLKKYAHQNGNLPQAGVKLKKIETTTLKTQLSGTIQMEESSPIKAACTAYTRESPTPTQPVPLFLVETFGQWLFLVPLIGGRWYIITQLAVYTTYITYIPLIYCQLGDYMVPTTY